MACAKSFPQVTGVAVKTAEVRDIASLDSLFTWGFMLKHCCVCVYGSDLAECFGEYVPSWEIAKHWNMDVEDWLAVYRNKIARATSVEQQIEPQKIIAKKTFAGKLFIGDVQRSALVRRPNRVWPPVPSIPSRKRSRDSSSNDIVDGSSHSQTFGYRAIGWVW